MADLGPEGKEREKNNEYRLVTIKSYDNGVISMKPDFSNGRKPYKISGAALKLELFEFTVENASRIMTRQEKDKERRIFKELYARHAEHLLQHVGSEFEVPPPGVLRQVCYGEIVSAKDFEYDNLYIQYFTELPRNWSCESTQTLSGTTPTVKSKVVGVDNVAKFGCPFNMDLVYSIPSVEGDDRDLIPHWPVLYMQVCSMDSMSRYRTEGYSHCIIPNSPGVHEVEVQCWRPKGYSLTGELRRFFIGGSPELEDPTYCAIPTAFEGNVLSKYGFRTESTGSIKLRINVIQQSRAFMSRRSHRRAVGSLIERLGIGNEEVQKGIVQVLEAFHKTRSRMLQARDNLQQEFQEMQLNYTRVSGSRGDRGDID